MVVADIAVSVAAVGMAFAVSGHAMDARVTDRATGIAASEYLAVGLRLPEIAERRLANLVGQRLDDISRGNTPDPYGWLVPVG